MDQEKNNSQNPQDWLKDININSDEAIASEADLAAQKWLEELLASTPATGGVEPTDVPEVAEVPEIPEIPVAEPEEEIPAPSQMSALTADEPSAEPEPDWFSRLESPAGDVQEIGADEQAVSAHGMSDLGDIELEKIIKETMDEDWDIAMIEQEILSEPIAEAFPTDSEKALEEDITSAIYADNGETEEEEEIEIDTQRKVRPKRKNGYGLFGLPHLVSVAIWAALCIAVGISLGRLVWICAADVLAFGRPDQDVVFTVEATDDLDSVAQKLQDAGLIKYPTLFKFYAQIADVKVGPDMKISTGTFNLNKMYDYHALVGGMSSTSSYRETIEVVIPEGYTCAQIFALLEERGVCTAAELEQYCTESQFSSYWFLEGVEKGNKYCLEGFLFPDTYEFYTNSSARLVFIAFLNNFGRHFSQDILPLLNELNERLAEMYRKNGLPEYYIEEHRLSVLDVIIIASMIEKETAYSGESPIIASVIYNRLTNPGNYPTLDIDATVIYALGGKGSLTSEDLKFDSPYNTYLYEGLPPGPISNPGQYSITAALNPENSQYYFYALDTTEEYYTHRFFRTYQEHKDFVDSLR